LRGGLSCRLEAPFGSASRDLRTISVKRVAPSLRSTVPLPDTSSDRKSYLEASAMLAILFCKGITLWCREYVQHCLGRPT